MRKKTTPRSSSRVTPFVSRLFSRRDRITLPLVLLLTLVAGVLRFTALDRPSIWGDEAMTYGRVCRTYQELVDQLTDSAFPPLHYAIEWWVGQGLPYWGTLAPDPDPAAPTTKPVFMPTKRLVEDGIPLTPFVLRFVPALAGTLMIPAIYWLARQLFGPRIGLTAALLACFSAYLLVYSRDAKMYMPFWLMVTLHVGCLLWWVRSRRPIAWACWVLCGAAMIGFHASGFYVLAIDALVVFTSPRQHWRKFVPLAGLVVWPLAAVPYGIYRGVVAWRRRRVARVATGSHDEPVDHPTSLTPAPVGPGSTGVDPAPQGPAWGTLRPSDRPAAVVDFSSRSFRFVLWPRLTWRRMRGPLALGLLVGVVLMAAGPVGYYVGASRKFEQIADRESAQTDTTDLGINWVARYNADRGLGGHLLYTGSAYLTGWEWPRNYSELAGDPAAMAARQYGIVPLDDQKNVPPRVLFALQQATVILLVLLAIGLVPWRRAFSPVRARLDRIRQEGRAWPAARSRRALWIAIWGLALPWAVYTQSFARPVNPLDAVATVMLKTPPDVRWPRAKWYAKTAAAEPSGKVQAATKPSAPVEEADASVVAAVRAYAEQESVRLRRSWADVSTGWPQAWKVYAAAFRRDNLRWPIAYGSGALAVMLLAFVVWKRLQIGRGAAGLTGVVGVVLVLGTLMTLVPQFVDANVWMPRYLGAALPALIVGAAVLIDRQPRGVRWATIVVFLLANMGQFAGRVWAGSEPPTARMAADVVASQSKKTVRWQPEKPTFRAYFFGGQPATSEPGGGTLWSGPGRYYLRLLSGEPSPAQEIRMVRAPGQPVRRYESRFDIATPAFAPQIVTEIKKSPQIERFVVWQTLGVASTDRTDAVGDGLKATFRRVNEETWIARDHWRWYERWQLRRREYERVVP